MDNKIKSTVYIDEAGDLGVGRGTQWFVLTAVIVDQVDEQKIRANMNQIKRRLNVKEIHLRNIQDFYRRAFIVRELSNENFTYINILADTNKFDRSKIQSPAIAYNYLCKLLLERVSWFLHDTNRIADIVLSARGTSRDKELIEYIKEKLLPYPYNEIRANVFDKITAKTAGSWDMLQLADVCATTLFLAHQINGWGFTTPCFTNVLNPHLYQRGNAIMSYGLKYFRDDMKPSKNLKHHRACAKKERTPGATST